MRQQGPGSRTSASALCRHRCRNSRVGSLTMARVKLCYALRRGVFYPSARDEFGEMPPRAERRRYLPSVKAMGFAAVEVPVDETGDEQSARDLARELADAGLDIGAVRGGGPLAHPLDGER